MKFYVRHWYSLNLIIGSVLLVLLILFWTSIEIVQKLVLVNLVALLVHQFEEYGFPGGEPMIMNYVLQGSDIPNRFPLNPFSAMFTNVFTGIVLYGLPFFFPGAVWFCLAPMLFNIGQVVVHGVMTNRKMNTFYNPGLGAVIFLHLPISIYFLWYVYSSELIGGLDWLWALLFTAFAAGFCVGIMTYVIFASRKTKWAFSPTEMKRFNVREKLEAKGITIDTNPDKQAKGPIGNLQKLQKRLHLEG